MISPPSLFTASFHTGFCGSYSIRHESIKPKPSDEKQGGRDRVAGYLCRRVDPNSGITMNESHDVARPTQHIALLMAVSCVRNTVIEDFHAQGKISDEEMKRFNKEVANKLYTFLDFMFDRPREDRENFFKMLEGFYPVDWDKPALDSELLGALESKEDTDD